MEKRGRTEEEKDGMRRGEGKEMIVKECWLVGNEKRGKRKEEQEWKRNGNRVVEVGTGLREQT